MFKQKKVSDNKKYFLYIFSIIVTILSFTLYVFDHQYYFIFITTYEKYLNKIKGS